MGVKIQELMKGEITQEVFDEAFREHASRTSVAEVPDEAMGAAEAEGLAAKPDQRTPKQILADINNQFSKKHND